MKPYLETDGVQVIVDDIIVAAKDDHEHDENMRTFLPRAREAIQQSSSTKSVSTVQSQVHGKYCLSLD